MVKKAKGSNKSVQLALLGVVAVLAVVGLVLLFSVARPSTGQVIGSYAPECSSHSDCSGGQYCGQIGGVVRCMDRQQLGARCYEDANCRSNACSNAGFCVNP